MSIINQMLKDLEDRKESTIKGRDGIISQPVNSATKSSAPLLLLSLLSAGLLAAVLYLLWSPQRGSVESEVAVINTMPQDETTTIASLITDTENEPTTTTPQLPQSSRGTQVVIAPRPVIRSPSTAAPEPASAPPLQSVSISGISPAELEGSWQRQRLTITGKNFTPESQVLLCWPAKCVTLKDYRINYRSPTELAIEFIAGIKEERWHLTVLNPNGQVSNAIEFHVKAATTGPATRPAMETDSTDSTDGDDERYEGITKRVLPLTPHQQAEAYYLEATQKSQSPAQAISLWERAILLAPEHHASRQALIGHLISTGRLVEAAEHLAQAIKLFPDHPIYHQRLAQIRVSQDDHSGALTILQNAISQGVSNAELYALSATLYQRNKQFEQSIESYQRALTLKPDNGIWWMGLGITFEQSGRIEESLSAYQQALNSGSLANKLRSYVEGQIVLNQKRLQNRTSD